MAKGTILFFKSDLADRAYGFICPDGKPSDSSNDVFVAKRAIVGAATLDKGDRVEYQLGPSRDGRVQAIDVRVISHASRAERRVDASWRKHRPERYLHEREKLWTHEGKD